MIFLVDEDIDVAVAAYLRSTHDVQEAREVFGQGTDDQDNVAWALAQNAILVTGDKRLANRLSQSRRCRCLHLLDLGTQELRRVTELLPVIEAEHSILGDRFWMQIRIDRYTIAR